MANNNIQGSPSFPRICQYDVFISFRGPDTRNGFVDHLYNHLRRKGIFAFKDDERIEKGESISSELIQAIKDSRISIIVFSKGYADSKWCLDEMAMIAECKKELEQKVFPVFYDVDPSHVRNQDGVYRNAFVSHTEKFIENQGKVDRWKSAMKELGYLAGWDIRNKNESCKIEDIVQKVIDKLRHKFSGIADDLIGIQSRVEGLEKLLELSSEDDDFRILGIWGMGGIGKTTHATVLYDRISYQFEACCFIENVSKMYKDGGATVVQKQILWQTLDEKNLNTYSPSEISRIIRDRLHNRKVLVVLDNVEHLQQLTELKIEPKLLSAESRMIITTRDEHILKVCGADEVYSVPLLNNEDACELFRRKAFKRGDPNKGCEELIPEILKYAQCLPLAIGVLGSFLCKRYDTQWRATLYSLERSADKDIMAVLQVSFDGLQETEKEIFLHIACFFKGERLDYVNRILDCCELYPNIGIEVLTEKSLISIKNEEIHMHQMLQELGKHIVREQFPNKPGTWSRLWLYKHFHNVMMSQTGTNNIEAIVLDQKGYVSKYHKLEAEEFSRMKSLKLLILHDEHFSGSLNFLSNSLHYLMWHKYPFTSLPLNFQPYGLVELNMPNSNMKRVWEDIKHLPYLKRMDLSKSKHLEETPNFEGTPNLERLDLGGCRNLSLVHSSIGLLIKLAFLNLRNCSSLVSLHFGTECKLVRLRVLQLSGCTKLENTPDFTGLSSLDYLDLGQCTKLSTVHESIGTLEGLGFLSLRGCENLVKMPIMARMMRLTTLDLSHCFKLMHFSLKPFPSSSLNLLTSMDLSFCNLSKLPDIVGKLTSLERLNLQGNKFVSLPHTISYLSRLAYLNFAHCDELQYIPRLPFFSSSSGGSYYKTVSGSRNHRSGLYIYDCPKCRYGEDLALSWLIRLVNAPHHFRCGFDIVAPGRVLPEWFNHQFKWDSVISIVDSNADDNWIGFSFCALFRANITGRTNRCPSVPGSSHNSSSSPLPHPFYLSFETEQAEETFNMPLRLDLDKIYSSEHFWLIYISRPHCHFVKTGALITFKANPDLEIRKWGLRMVFKQDVKEKWWYSLDSQVGRLPLTYNVHKSKGSSGPKIKLPYNWLVTDEEEKENKKAKGKENKLSNAGLTARPSKRHKASSSSFFFSWCLDCLC